MQTTHKPMEGVRNERGKTNNLENWRLGNHGQKRRTCRANRSHKPFSRRNTEIKLGKSCNSAWWRKLRAASSTKIRDKRRLERRRAESGICRNPSRDDRSQRLSHGRAGMA